MARAISGREGSITMGREELRDLIDVVDLRDGAVDQIQVWVELIPAPTVQDPHAEVEGWSRLVLRSDGSMVAELEDGTFEVLLPQTVRRFKRMT
jgi:hypothetical protein